MDDAVDKKQEAAAIDQPAAQRLPAQNGPLLDGALDCAIEEALNLRLRQAPTKRLEAMLATVTAAFAARRSKP